MRTPSMTAAVPALAAVVAGAVLPLATASPAAASERTERITRQQAQVVNNALQEHRAEHAGYPARLTERFWRASSSRLRADVRVTDYLLRDGGGDSGRDQATYRFCVVHDRGGWTTFDLRDDRDAPQVGVVDSGPRGAACRFTEPTEPEPDVVDVLLGVLGLD